MLSCMLWHWKMGCRWGRKSCLNSFKFTRISQCKRVTEVRSLLRSSGWCTALPPHPSQLLQPKRSWILKIVPPKVRLGSVRTCEAFEPLESDRTFMATTALMTKKNRLSWNCVWDFSWKKAVQECLMSKPKTFCSGGRRKQPNELLDAVHWEGQIT
jgi:hypothetical protein